MKILITGATGLVGNAIARKLVARGHEVRALVRDPARAAPLLPGAELARGDITDRASVLEAARGVEWLFHAAGMPEQWQPDDAIFDRVNREGTKNVVRAALEAGVRRVIYTSTMDVFEAEQGGTLVEDRIDPRPKHSAYERSKQAAEREADAAVRDGLELVFVNPSAVYGPSPVHVALNSFFIKLMRREVPMLPPGGMSIVFVDGCAEAHIAAAEKGRPGQRYLVSDTFVSNAELAREIVRQAGLPKVPRSAPAALLKVVARINAPIARALKKDPLIAPGQLAFLLWSPRVDSKKAQRELGFSPQPLEAGVKETITFLRGEGLVPG